MTQRFVFGEHTSILIKVRLVATFSNIEQKMINGVKLLCCVITKGEAILKYFFFINKLWCQIYTHTQCNFFFKHKLQFHVMSWFEESDISMHLLKMFI